MSGQLEAEIAALALTNVYTFGPTFRAENSNTSRHLAEFWMVEPEMAFCDLAGDIEIAEAFLKSLFRDVLEACPEDMAFFDERIDNSVLATLRHVIEEPFERMTYTEAVERLQRSGKAFEFPVEWGRDLQSEHERWLAEEHVRRPVIVTDYPVGIKAFYMYRNDDGRSVRAMDVLVPKLGEIIGGSQREHRLDVLRERLRDCGAHRGALRLVPRPAPPRLRPPRRLRSRLRARRPVHDRHGQHPGRDPLPARAGLRGVLSRLPGRAAAAHRLDAAARGWRRLPPRAPAGAGLIQIENVSRVYRRGADEVHALEHVTLHIPAGRFVALMGPSGSGKSTLLNLLAGLDRPNEGSVTVAGRRLNDLSEDELAQFRSQHVGFVFQFFNLIPVLSARANVELPLLLTVAQEGPAARARGHGAADRGARASAAITCRINCRAASSSAWRSRARS